MRRKLLLAICALLGVALVAAGCLQASPLKTYREARDKTEGAGRAQVMVQFSHNMTFDGQKLTDESRKTLETFKEVKGSFVHKYDRDKGISCLEGHVDMMGMGFDMKVFQDRDRTVLMLPMFTKYLVVDNRAAADPGLAGGGAGGRKDKPWEKAGERLEEIWDGLAGEKNITRSGNRYVSTPEGDVKTTEFRIAAGSQEVGDLIQKSVDVITTDPGIRSAITENLVKYGKDRGITAEEAGRAFDELAAAMRESAGKITVDNFQQVVSVDKDGYVVEESASCSTSFEAAPGISVGVEFSLKIKRWGFGKEIQVDFPALDGGNSFKVEDFDKNTPKVFEGLIKTGWEKNRQ